MLHHGEWGCVDECLRRVMKIRSLQARTANTNGPCDDNLLVELPLSKQRWPPVAHPHTVTNAPSPTLQHFPNNNLEQDHRAVKKRVRLAKGYAPFQTAWRTLQGIETMHTINKGRVRWLAKGDAVGQAHFVATMFDIAA